MIATLTETAAWLRTRAAQADHLWSAPLAIEALLQQTSSALDGRPTAALERKRPPLRRTMHYPPAHSPDQAHP